MTTIIIFGHGYVARFLIKAFNSLGWRIVCTSRKMEIGLPLQNGNLVMIHFLDPILVSILSSSDIILNTIPPNEDGVDPVLEKYGDVMAKQTLKWIGYLSSTSVYGDHKGAWVDEKTECMPSHEKASRRLSIERQWLDLYVLSHAPVHIFRLAGIYGPNRNCLEDIMRGKDFTIVKNNHYFSRIHIEDICQGLIASIHSPTAGEIYNMSDEEPAPLHQVQQFGAKILGKNKLKEILQEKSSLSKHMNMFFQDNKKVNSQKILNNLSISLIYPHYRSGLLKGCLPYLERSTVKPEK